MPMVMLSKEKFVEYAKLEGVKVVYVLDTPALRLVRMGKETIDGVRTPTNFVNDRSAVEKATSEDAEIGGVPKPAAGTGMYWTINGDTKYLLTAEGGVWLAMKTPNMVVLAPVASADDAKAALESMKSKADVKPPLALPVKTFCIYSIAQ